MYVPGNIALYKKTAQSSIFPANNGYTAGDTGKVVDGDFDTNYLHESCSSTYEGSGQPNWLSVDLEQTYTIVYVALMSRSDASGG